MKPKQTTNPEEREQLLASIIDGATRYIRLSPSPHVAMLTVMDGLLGVLSQDWQLTRSELLELLVHPEAPDDPILGHSATAIDLALFPSV